jgi:hypothetical protein
MATRTDRFMDAALRAAKRAKQWATAAAREADRLLREAEKRAITRERHRRLKKALVQTSRVMKAAGKAAVIAGVAAAIAAARHEHAEGKALKRGKR